MSGRLVHVVASGVSAACSWSRTCCVLALQYVLLLTMRSVQKKKSKKKKKGLAQGWIRTQYRVVVTACEPSALPGERCWSGCPCLYGFSWLKLKSTVTRRRKQISTSLLYRFLIKKLPTCTCKMKPWNASKASNIYCNLISTLKMSGRLVHVITCDTQYTRHVQLE